MSRKKRSLKERLVGLVVALVVASVWFAFRRSLDSEKEIVKLDNKTVLAEKSDTKAESEPKDDSSAWYSAEDEAYMVPLNEGLKVPEQLCLYYFLQCRDAQSQLGGVDTYSRSCRR